MLPFFNRKLRILTVNYPIKRSLCCQWRYWQNHVSINKYLKSGNIFAPAIIGFKISNLFGSMIFTTTAIMVSSIGYGSAIAENNKKSRLQAAEEIRSLYDVGRLDDAFAMVEAQNLTDEQIGQYGVSRVVSASYFEKGDIPNGVKYMKLDYKYYSDTWSEEQLSNYKAALIGFYHMNKQCDEVFDIVDTMTMNEIQQANLEYRIAECYYILNIYDKYTYYAEKYLANPKSKDEYIKHIIYRQMAVYYRMRKQYHRAIAYLHEMDIDELKSQGMEYMLGNSYHMAGDFQKATKYYKSHLETMNGDFNKHDVINAYHNLGAISFLDNDLQHAYEYWSVLGDNICKQRRLPILRKDKWGYFEVIDEY
eukprot:408809_1